MKLGVLTSVDTRHRYFAHMLSERCNVVAVVYERVGYSHASLVGTDLSHDEIKVVTNHFAERTRLEELNFGHQAFTVPESDTCCVRTMPSRELNTPDTLAFLEQAGVDTVAVFGTNLVKPPLLGRWAGRMINMHLGLSPYYRGTATNFYPLLNEEPEYVGATLHLLDAGIDSGPILRHVRPDIEEGDGPHDIGCRAIQAGTEAMGDVLEGIEAGHIKPVPQWSVPNPRLYLRKDYHPRQVVELYRKLDNGLIPRYLERIKRTPSQLRLVE